MKNYEKAIVINDLHFPFVNQKALNLAMTIAYKVQPDIIFVNGDLLDCWQISRFVKNPALTPSANLGYEILRGREFLKYLRHHFPKSRIIYIFGNHEYRWATYISTHAVELYGLKGLSLEEQLECKESGVEVVNSGNKESMYMWGKLVIGHFDKVNKHSGYTAKNLLEDKGISLIQAHTHRGGSSYRRMYDRDIVAFENFCLCDRNPTYAQFPNWQLGFSLVYKDKESDFFQIVQYPIVEIKEGEDLVYKCLYEGLVYET